MAMTELISKQTNSLQLGALKLTLPMTIIDAGKPTAKRFVEFFTANIRNANTREAYGRAVRDFFAWCEGNQIGALIDIEAIHVAAYIEKMTREKAAQTVKQRLAAIKALFDFLVTGGVLATNPASAVRGPRYSTKKGKTPILLTDDARALIKSIPTDTVAGLRDRAIISVMTYSFSRISATLAMDVKDVFTMHHRLWLRLIEKGGKHHEVPCHHNLETYLREYIEAASLSEGALFRTFKGRSKKLSEKRLHRTDSLAMIKRRCRQAGIENADMICNHTFRGTGITAYLSNDDSKLEHAQQIAGHADPKTTLLYDRRSDEITLDEVEKIGI